MQKLWYIIIINFLFIVCIQAQDNTIDSLEALLSDSKIKNREKLFNELSEAYVSVTLDKSLSYATNAAKLAKKSNNQKELGRAYKNSGKAYHHMKELDKAENFYKDAIPLLESSNQTSELSDVYYNLGHIQKSAGNYSKAVDYFEKSLKISEEMNDLEQIAMTQRTIGICYFYHSRFNKAVEAYEKSLAIREQLNDLQGVASTLQTIGIVYHEWCQYEKALDIYQQSLKTFDKIIQENPDDETLKQGYANSLMNISQVYKDWGKFKQDKELIYKSLDYLNQTLIMMREMGDKIGIAYSLSNIGVIYDDLGEYAMAIEYFQQSLDIEEAEGDKAGAAGTYLYMGNTYLKWEDSEKALELYEKSLYTYKLLENRQGIAECLLKLGDAHMARNESAKAIKSYESSLEISKELGLRKTIQDNSYALCQIMRERGDYKTAIEYYDIFTEQKDSILNIESARLLSEMKEKYESDEKDKEIEILNKEQQVSDLRIKNQRRLIFTFIAGIVLILIFAVILVRQVRKTKLANDKLAVQNDEILQQKRSITDSIHYARRIQTAILVPNKVLQDVFTNYFIINKPRDIVSGDFYWMAQSGQKTVFTVADCTGHGVPGAFMSILGIAFLNEIVNTYADLTSGQILDKLREQVIRALHQKDKSSETKDGMDISLCCFDKESKILEFSGANNSMLMACKGNETMQAAISENFIRRKMNCNDNGYCIFELVADKMPIGVHFKEDLKPFTTKSIKITEETCIYLYSDGYIDQFGGDINIFPNGTKFKSSGFHEMIIELAHESTEIQKEIIENRFLEWKGNFDQVDDIMVLGIRLM